MLYPFKSSYLVYLSLALAYNAQAATNADFVQLKVKLKEYIAENPDRNIPLLVRNSFHDLFLQDKAAMMGCLIKEPFVNDFENKGLDGTVNDLKSIVSKNFANAGFSFGDVIAFAGKIAVESAYPCINIDFKFNRGNCTQAKPNFSHQAPSAFIDTIDQLVPMLDYLGPSITAEDMAILFAGAHGIKGARAGPSGWFGVFSTFSSGKDFILDTFSSTWKFISNEQTLAEFFKGDTFNRQTSIIRLPTDMIFYPSKIPESSPKDSSVEASTIEAKLKAFTTQNRNAFDQEFAKAYAKLLAIGNGDQNFVETVSLSLCPNRPGEQPGENQSTTTVKTTTLKTTSTLTTKMEPTGITSSLTTKIQNTETMIQKTSVSSTCMGEDCELDGGKTIVISTVLQVLVSFLIL